MLPVMTSTDSWSKPDKLATSSCPLNMDTVPVTLLLSQITKYTGRILNESCYLTTVLAFSSLSNWIASCEKNSNTKESGNSSSSTTMKNQSDDIKIPSFRIPKFTGDTLAGDTYIKSVDNFFRFAAIAKYLLSEVFCDSSLSWLDAFASRLRESIC